MLRFGDPANCTKPRTGAATIVAEVLEKRYRGERSTKNGNQDGSETTNNQPNSPGIPPDANGKDGGREKRTTGNVWTTAAAGVREFLE